VPHEVNAAIKGVKAAPRNTVLDRSPLDTGSLELAERDQPSLAGRNRRYCGIALVFGDFGMTVMPNSPETSFHATFIAHNRRWSPTLRPSRYCQIHNGNQPHQAVTHTP